MQNKDVVTLAHSQATLSPRTLTLASQALADVQRRYAEALNHLSAARHHLELARAERLVEGVEGRNAEEREARVRLTLQDEHAHVLAAEAALNTSRSELEVARLEWDCLRYQVRLIEALKDEGVAA